MSKNLIKTLWAVIFFIGTMANASNEPLNTVNHVDIPKYMGVWYEIASYPQWFSRNCYNTSATYTLRGDGKVDVINKCHKGSPTGPVKTARGVAQVANSETNAELKVSFFWPFSGDYWIIELGDQYEYAVVSEPGRSTLWILSRTPDLDQETLNNLLDRLKHVHGFELAKLQYTRG